MNLSTAWHENQSIREEKNRYWEDNLALRESGRKAANKNMELFNIIEAKDEEIRQLRLEIQAKAEELQGLRDAVEVGQVVAGSMGERSGELPRVNATRRLRFSGSFTVSETGNHKRRSQRSSTQPQPRPSKTMNEIS